MLRWYFHEFFFHPYYAIVYTAYTYYGRNRRVHCHVIIIARHSGHVVFGEKVRLRPRRVVVASGGRGQCIIYLTTQVRIS